MGTYSAYIDIGIMILIPIVFLVSMFLPYPSFGTKSKDEHNKSNQR